MNRRDFESIAQVVKRLAGERNGGQSKETVAEALAQLVPADARAKFLKACGVSNAASE